MHGEAHRNQRAGCLLSAPTAGAVVGRRDGGIEDGGGRESRARAEVIVGREVATVDHAGKFIGEVRRLAGQTETSEESDAEEEGRGVFHAARALATQVPE